MIVTNSTPEDLKKLPLRAIFASAAPGVRRVEHLAYAMGNRPSPATLAYRNP